MGTEFRIEEVALLQSKVNTSLRRKPNVVGCGVGYKMTAGRCTESLALVVLVRQKQPSHVLAEAERVEREISGVPTDVIEVGDVRLLGWPAPSWQEANPSLRRVPDPERLKRVRPAQPGVSIGHYLVTAGTFGAVVRKHGRTCILSNNHVLANGSNGRDGRARRGDPILQPGPYDGGLVNEDPLARLAWFEPLLSTDDMGPRSGFARGLNRLLGMLFGMKLAPEEPPVNTVDVALAEPVDPGLVSPELLGLGKVTGVAKPELGMKVRKSGRTSGVTEGRLIAVNVQMEVGYGDRSAEFANQLLFTRMSEPGDSGALVVDENGQGVGLLFAGSDRATLANRLDLALEACGASLS